MSKEFPPPDDCPFCGKSPMTLVPAGTKIPHVYCMTPGCITYGSPESAIPLHVWNSRPTPKTINGHKFDDFKKLADIGAAFILHVNLPLNERDETIMRVMKEATMAWSHRRNEYNPYEREEQRKIMYERQRFEDGSRYREMQEAKRRAAEKTVELLPKTTKGVAWRKMLEGNWELDKKKRK